MATKFEALFDNWADSYDQSVYGHDEQYKEVFAGYDSILDAVVNRTQGTVLEFGVGTGNLTQKLVQKGHRVYGIEPSQEMRKRAQSKVPQAHIVEGDFLDFPPVTEPIQSIVSTYAFHHLTDEEKNEAIHKFSQLLQSGSKVIFADTVFENEDARVNMMEKVTRQGFQDLLNDLRTEYYTTIDVLEDLFVKHRFQVSFAQLNDFVWLIEAVRD